MKALKRMLISSAAAVMAFLPFTFPVHAESEPQGSITVKISEPLQGRTFRVYQVENGDGDLTEPFKELPEYLYGTTAGTTSDVLKEKNADTAKTIQAYIDDNPKVDFHSVYTVYSDTEEFTGLSEGLYLVMQTEAPKGYERIESFLVDMPHTVDNSHLTYSVECNPKTEPASPEATAKPAVVQPTVAPEKSKYSEDAQSGMGFSAAMYSIMVSGIMLTVTIGLVVISIFLFKAYKSELETDSEEDAGHEKKKKK